MHCKYSNKLIGKIKVPGYKKIGIDVTACTKVDGLSLMINGKYADVVTEQKETKDGCTTKSFSINLGESPLVMGDITVILKEFVLFFFSST